MPTFYDNMWERPKNLKRRNMSQKARRRRWLYARNNGDSATVPYSERVVGTGWKDVVARGWKGSAITGQDALKSNMELRGDHVITVGLTRGGQVGERINDINCDAQ